MIFVDNLKSYLCALIFPGLTEREDLIERWLGEKGFWFYLPTSTPANECFVLLLQPPPPLYPTSDIDNTASSFFQGGLEIRSSTGIPQAPSTFLGLLSMSLMN